MHESSACLPCRPQAGRPWHARKQTWRGVMVRLTRSDMSATEEHTTITYITADVKFACRARAVCLVKRWTFAGYDGADHFWM